MERCPIIIYFPGGLFIALEPRTSQRCCMDHRCCFHVDGTIALDAVKSTLYPRGK
jgi:hypothetical protein